MTTQISTKLAALGIALTMNILLIAGVAYMFSAQSPHNMFLAGAGLAVAQGNAA